MIQEYLFVTDKYRDEMAQLAVQEKIAKEIRTIENSPCWTLCLSVDGNSEKAAKLLDPLNTEICERYEPTVLSNECSAYFNQSLFPIVNEFERKLRKLLYLASALQGDKKAHEVIADLESKDLGKIFVALFSDSDFVKHVKDRINEKTWQFTRGELLATIEELDENTLWDRLLGCDCVETLRKQFGELRTYRNDVMHAHNINWKRYQSAKQLFQKVNEELDVAIGKLFGAKEENEPLTFVNFNDALGLALCSIQNQVDTSGLFTVSEMLRKLITIQTVISPEATSALKDFLEKMPKNKIEIPPAIMALQRSLSEINMGILLKDKNSINEDEGDKANG